MRMDVPLSRAVPEGAQIMLFEAKAYPQLDARTLVDGYTGFVQTARETLAQEGFANPKSLEQLHKTVEAALSIVWSRYTQANTATLLEGEAAKSPTRDCDTSSYDMMGILSGAGVKTRLVVVPDHMFIKVMLPDLGAPGSAQSFYIETLRDRDGPLFTCYESEARMRERYPLVYGEYEFSPQLPTLYLQRGIAFLKDGQSALAEADFDQAIARLPGFADAYYNRGLVRTAHGAPGLGAQDYETVVRLLAGAWDTRLGESAYYNLGTARLNMQQLEKTIAAYTAAIGIGERLEGAELDGPRPRYLDAYYNRGIAYQRNGDEQKALEDFSAIIARDPDDADAYFLRSRIYLARGESELAQEDLDRCRKIRQGKKTE